MADWKKILSRGNVEDRRGMSPAVVGGLSLTGFALILLVNYLNGGDLGTVLNDVGNQVVQQQSQNATSTTTDEFAGEDEYEIFASTVLGSNNDNWNKVFSGLGKEYTAPKLVLFRQATQSGCGGASSEVGPHYCNTDTTIYLDETFFDLIYLKNSFVFYGVCPDAGKAIGLKFYPDRCIVGPVQYPVESAQ